MLLHFRLHYLLFLTLFFVACDKGPKKTTLNGIITDYKTGAPIANAGVSYGSYSISGPPMPGPTGYTTSNSEGLFTILLDEEYCFAGFQINKANYLPHLNFAGGEVSVECGKTNDAEFRMRPLDAVIRLVCTNSQPFHDSIYIKAQNNTLKKVLGFSGLHSSLGPYDTPMILTVGESKVSDVRFLSGEMAYIYWGYNQFWQIEQAAYRDSVFLTAGDTAVFQINF